MKNKAYHHANKKTKRTNVFVLVGFLLPIIPCFADIQPKNASFNYSQKALSTFGNAASPALVIERNDPHLIKGGMIEFGGGIEYGDIDELLDTYNNLANEFNPPSNDNPDSDIPDSPENPILDYTWDDLVGEYPGLEEQLDVIKVKVINTAALVALISTEGYAKAEVSTNAAFVLNEDLYGGTLLIGMGFKGNAKAIGIFEEINFDRNQAKAELEKIPQLGENDPIQALDLSGGVTLHYNPANHGAKLSIDNDSLLLTKAAKVSQFSLSYSRKFLHSEQGDLYWGIKPTLYRVGLTSIDTRIGDITDVKDLFGDIKDSSYVYKSAVDFDLGLVWAASYYQLGVSLNNAIEKEYKFPELDRSKYGSAIINERLDYHHSYTMERQVKLEGAIFTAQRELSLNVELDANSVVDPMKDGYQWLTVTGGYAADSWWLPSARIGFSRNLAGTKLAYVNAGVTVMKLIDIDIATTLDTVSINGNEMIRGASIRFGVQFDY